jgi:hypothetical protein
MTSFERHGNAPIPGRDGLHAVLARGAFQRRQLLLAS